MEEVEEELSSRLLQHRSLIFSSSSSRPSAFSSNPTPNLISKIPNIQDGR